MVGLIKAGWTIARQQRIGGTSGEREGLWEEERWIDASETLKKSDTQYRGGVIKPCGRTQIRTHWKKPKLRPGSHD